jgi:hypothetical protein
VYSLLVDQPRVDWAGILFWRAASGMMDDENETVAEGIYVGNGGRVWDCSFI